jgi:hypothetical protein
MCFEILERWSVERVLKYGSGTARAVRCSSQPVRMQETGGLAPIRFVGPTHFQNTFLA